MIKNSVLRKTENSNFRNTEKFDTLTIIALEIKILYFLVALLPPAPKPGGVEENLRRSGEVGASAVKLFNDPKSGQVLIPSVKDWLCLDHRQALDDSGLR